MCQRTLARAVPIITGDKQTSISTQLLVLSIDFGSSVSTKRGCSSWINLATSLLHKPRAIMALAQTFLHSLFKLPHLYDRVFIKVVSYSTLNLRDLYILSQRNEWRSYPPTFSLQDCLLLFSLIIFPAWPPCKSVVDPLTCPYHRQPSEIHWNAWYSNRVISYLHLLFSWFPLPLHSTRAKLIFHCHIGLCSWSSLSVYFRSCTKNYQLIEKIAVVIAVNPLLRLSSRKNPPLIRRTVLESLGCMSRSVLYCHLGNCIGQEI